MCLTGNRDVPHREWGCASPGMHILTGNRNVPHREWEFASSGIVMCLTGNGDVPHQECTSSPGMHVVYTGCLYNRESKRSQNCKNGTQLKSSIVGSSYQRP